MMRSCRSAVLVLVLTLMHGALPAKKPLSTPLPLPLVHIVVIADPDGRVDPGPILQALSQGFRVAERRLDPGVPEAKTIIARTGLNAFPAFVVKEAGLKGAARERVLYFQKTGQFLKKGGWYFIPPHLISERTLPARLRIPRRLDVFIMSLCPYSNAAMRGISFALKEKKAPPDLAIFVHYSLAAHSVSRTARGIAIVKPLLSLHGGPEVEENIRQLVIRKYFPDRWAQYIFQRSYDFTSTYWDDAAKKAGVDEAQMKQHVREEGEQLLMENALFAAELSVPGTPVFLWENRTFLTASSVSALTGIPMEVTGNCQQQ